MLTSCNYFVDYIDAVLLDERSALTVDVIYEFLTTFFPKVPYLLKYYFLSYIHDFISIRYLLMFYLIKHCL